VKFDSVWAKIKFLHPQKHSISFGNAPVTSPGDEISLTNISFAGFLRSPQRNWQLPVMYYSDLFVATVTTLLYPLIYVG